jgi:hypothetical protein
MNLSKVLYLYLFIVVGVPVNAQTINVRGVVSTRTGKPISNAIIKLVGQGLSVTTGRDGAYSIVKPSVAVLPAIAPDEEKISLDKGVLHFQSNTPSVLKVDIFDLQGNLLKKLSSDVTMGKYHLNILDNSIAEKLLFIRVSIMGRGTTAFRYLSLNSGKYTVNAPGGRSSIVDGSLVSAAAVNDTLITTATPYITKNLAISSYNQVVNITLDSTGGADSYEPDNKRESASTLTPLGTTQTHTLTANDTDWVKFTADSGAYYLVQTTNPYLAKGYLYPGSSSTPLMEFGGTVGGSLKWRFPKSGTWYAQIFVANRGQTGVYTFNVSAKWVFFTSPVAKAEWTAGNSYPIEWSSSISLTSTAHLNLFKGSHQILSISDNPKQKDSITWTVPQGMATGKDYRLCLDLSFSDTFSIIGLEPDKYEPDDVRNNSLPDIHAGTEIHTLTVNDTDWFKYWSTPEGVLVIKATPSSSSMPLRLDCYPNALTTIPIDSSVVLATSTTGVVFKITSSSFGSYSIASQFRNTREGALVTSPASGSSWSIGQTIPIKWNSVSMGGTVTIQFANNSNRPTVYSVPDTGTYLWTIDSTFTPYQSNYVQVTSSLHNSLYGVSRTFTIIDK